MTTDDAPRPALDAALVERLREEYSPEPEPRDCLRIPCGYRGPLRLVRTDDLGWRGWCCPKCGESVRYSAPGDPDVLALLAAYDAAAARADRYERALTTIQGWDCLNPPNEALCGDFPWLRRLVDRVLRGGEALREDDGDGN